MQKCTVICDSCGEPIEAEEASPIVIVPCESIKKSRKIPPNTMAAMMGATSQKEPDQFDLCPSCVMAMLVRLYNNRKSIKETGKVVLA
jgi:hypothetical protein